MFPQAFENSGFSKLSYMKETFWKLRSLCISTTKPIEPASQKKPQDTISPFSPTPYPSSKGTDFSGLEMDASQVHHKTASLQ